MPPYSSCISWNASRWGVLNDTVSETSPMCCLLCSKNGGEHLMRVFLIENSVANPRNACSFHHRVSRVEAPYRRREHKVSTHCSDFVKVGRKCSNRPLSRRVLVARVRVLSREPRQQVPS